MDPPVEFVEDDGVLAAVPIPPDGPVAVRFGKYVGPRVLLHSFLCFPGSGVAPVYGDRGGDVGVPALSEGGAGIADTLRIFERDLGVVLEQFAVVRSLFDRLVRRTDVRPTRGLNLKRVLEPYGSYT